MRVAVVGCGTAGPAVALLLARGGHEVEILERVADPDAVGAGILLQALGQRVLAELDLADELEACSTPIRRVDARTRRGRAVMDFGFDEVLPGSHAWGVHRGALFGLLFDAVRRAGIPIRTGHEVVALEHAADGVRLRASDGRELGPFDLVVGADGARSRLRRLGGLARTDVGYPYGALWAVVPDPDHLAQDVLWQCYADTRVTLGILPTGVAEASLFWSVRSREIDAALTAGPEAWVRRALPYARHLAPLVERALSPGLLAARYRDVVVQSPAVVRARGALVLIGDAAHAMSPQLGLGASLGLADAWTLGWALRERRGDLAGGLATYARARRGHVRWYTWCSRFMTPVFQSDLVPAGWARDLMLGPVARIPWVRRQFVTTLMGIRTSPWSTWDLPG